LVADGLRGGVGGGLEGELVADGGVMGHVGSVRRWRRLGQ
jgi:hypothetical protein